MPNRAVTLYLRIKTADGKKPFCKPVYLAKGRLKPLYALVDGEPEHRPEGVYYMRFGVDSGRQQMVPLGNDSYLALATVSQFGVAVLQYPRRQSFYFADAEVPFRVIDSLSESIVRRAHNPIGPITH